MDAFLFVIHHLFLLHSCSPTCKSSYHYCNPAPGVCVFLCVCVFVCIFTHFHDSFLIPAKSNFYNCAQKVCAGVCAHRNTHCIAQRQRHTHTHTTQSWVQTQTDSHPDTLFGSRLRPAKGKQAERIKFPDTSLNTIGMRTS